MHMHTLHKHKPSYWRATRGSSSLRPMLYPQCQRDRDRDSVLCWGHVLQMRCFTKVLTACHSRSHDTRCKRRGANPAILVPIPYKPFYQPGHLILPWSLIGFPHSSPPDRILAAGHHLAKCYTLVMVEVLYTPHSDTNYVKCFGCLRKCCINVINYVNYNNYSAQ